MTALPEDFEGGAALLLRHAARPEIPRGSFGHDLSITDHGRRQAFELGHSIGSRLGRVVSSSVPRCMQTAVAIVEGSGLTRDLETDRRLGDPGPWIADAEIVGDAFLTDGPREVVRRQLVGTVPGIHPLAHGAAHLLRCLLRPAPRPGTTNVFVSHDAVIAPLLGHLLGQTGLDAHWPEFLEGVSVRAVGNRVVVHWRAITVTLGAEVLDVP